MGQIATLIDQSGTILSEVFLVFTHASKSFTEDEVERVELGSHSFVWFPTLLDLCHENKGLQSSCLC